MQRVSGNPEEGSLASVFSQDTPPFHRTTSWAQGYSRGQTTTNSGAEGREDCMAANQKRLLESPKTPCEKENQKSFRSFLLPIPGLQGVGEKLKFGSKFRVR